MVPEKELLPANDKHIQGIMTMLVETAKKSTCLRSRCGAMVVNLFGDTIGYGYNSPADSCIKPAPFDKQMPKKLVSCIKDHLGPGFKSDKTCCMHAEQRAILNALQLGHKVRGAFLYFIRIDENGAPLYTGQPYCTMCSKMALDVGISRFILYHEEGWTSYSTDYYNKLSFYYGQN